MPAASIYRRKWVLVKLPLVLLALALCAWLWIAFLPLPPGQLSISTGRPDGIYHGYGLRYAKVFESHGVDLKVLPSDGAEVNLARLRGQAQPQADLAFVQGGLSAPSAAGAGGARVETIARVDTEPVWIFSRVPGLDSLEQFQGLQRQNEYPDYQSDFPLSPVAQQYAAGHRPWLEYVLPYWWAQLAGLLLYALLPIAILAGIALVWIPRLFSLRVDAVLAHYYGELSFLDRDLDAVASESPIRIKTLLAKLDQMEHEVASLDLPDRFADRWYTLRQHLVLARERLLKLRAR